jgi:hypothetical protein
VEHLSAGDLCVVVPTEHDNAFDRAAGVIGRIVVLLRPFENMHPLQERFRPFWACSGLPAGIVAVSALALRKIPPARILEDEPTDEELSV